MSFETLEKEVKELPREFEETGDTCYLLKDPENADRESADVLADVIERIDFKALQNIFESIAAKSGIDPSKMNFVGPERFYDMTSMWDTLGRWNSEHNVIALNGSALKRSAERAGVDTELRVLSTLVHEEVHATSRYKSEIVKTQAGDREKITTGYGKYRRGNRSKGLKGEVFFDLLNEGVVELLAREVLLEYIRTTDFTDSRKVKEFMEAHEQKPEEMSGYWLAIKFVDVLVDKVSVKTGTDRNSVWRSFVRGLYEGVDFETKEFSQPFQELFGENFLQKLSKANFSKDIEALMKELETQ
ncbi:MAG: hypothetical protein UY26_C0003G0089 [Candidatus Jorgensenbacteria bacterium GW2011_GWA1_48_13]|uniref:Uncharacterized protein n=2 Tax=Candidatus Joergenseniibacteriota TaxID=1752739 RepID=A0A0G1W8K5_9BACT|nr:MAG: hypothetical protein UY26_C0003G0089 [Candidatus Jorgensenbacteria bacterium GW2011_GWA1_48_13]KKU98597.1 MAG: hypothetical protein UY32_C0020G0005 [Candidatus Jorgensenbacteria bacterium GW2011_GWC1_48_8]KKW15048.1 MAG: hypothetical protein UY55_C0002G0106 [Candidatus Jorgensenbacteria bacterium GW2011_GWB1_50_10]